MVLVFYYSMFIISLIFVVVYAFIFHKHFDANITILTVLIPVINLGFVLMGHATIIEEALIALRLTYIGGCFVIVAAMFMIFKICGVELKPWLRALIILTSSLVYASTLTIGHTDLFYKGIPSLAYFGEAAYITDKHYGIMHTIFYIMVGLYYAATIGVIIYSFFKKKQVPRKVLILIIIAVTIAVVGFFGGRLITKKFEILPLTYNLGMVLYILIASRLRLYDASDSVTDSLVEKGETGFISFDLRCRYLGSNDTAKQMIFEISDYKVDHYIKDFDIASKYILPNIEKFKTNPENDKFYLELNNRTYLLHINTLKVFWFYHGYQLLISDDTKNQQYIKLIQNYNSELEKEVAEKTKNIQEIQNKFVLGMATMVEGRDNSTGGHIKRTSDCMAILINVMKEEKYPGFTEEFCADIVRAAPMHDLGKITVDDAILRKPGRFIPEEFEQMKKHSSEGARIIKKILEGTDNTEFVNIAINVAHYHHERWDGSGYPSHLKGEEIPFEARIMAIVDVYDALVSKRVYKESMTFEEANKIILEGMGTHFDKRLEPYYLKARPKFEQYYLENNN